ncbi:MAG: hypothetical protein KGQ46_04015 [Hyphomicrobiales bacterium]|nr:hypothetical protein [Hyphomicrobiales bacterium]MDE2115825.1 hypothetical protein [Hyphomicrobiales bacterium]
MLSIMVYVPAKIALDDAAGGRRLVRTLAALVPGVVHGTLARVGLAGPLSAGLTQIAQEAGCDWHEAQHLGQAYLAAQSHFTSPWQGLLMAGNAPAAGFFEVIDDLMREPMAKGTAFLGEPQNLAARLSPFQDPAALLWRRGGPVEAAPQTLRQLAKSLKVTHVSRLKMRAIN